MKNYKIFRSVYIDKDGDEIAPYYFIKKLERILWFGYWKTVTHQDYLKTDGGTVITHFHTYDDAYNFIINVLSKNKIRQKRIDAEVAKVDI
jgi:hypothetical protein